MQPVSIQEPAGRPSRDGPALPAYFAELARGGKQGCALVEH